MFAQAPDGTRVFCHEQNFSDFVPDSRSSATYQSLEEGDTVAGTLVMQPGKGAQGSQLTKLASERTTGTVVSVLADQRCAFVRPTKPGSADVFIPERAFAGDFTDLRLGDQVSFILVRYRSKNRGYQTRTQ